MKNKKIVLLAGLLLLQTLLLAQAPNWTNAGYRKTQYNDNIYITGYASQINTNKANSTELLQQLEVYAKGQMAEFILVAIKSEATLKVNDDGQNVEQSFASVKHSQTNIQLSNIKVETYYNPKDKVAHVFTYAKRADLINYYSGIIDKNLTESERKTTLANNLLNNDTEQALKHGLETLTLVSEIEQAQTIIMALKRDGFDANIQMDRLIAIKNTVDNVMRKAQSGSANDLDGACNFIARALKLKTNQLNSPVVISNFTYNDTRAASELSNRISQSLTPRLVNIAGYNVTQMGNNTNAFILTGTYWTTSTEIKLIATLKNPDGNIIATTEAMLPFNWVKQNNISYLPENFEDAFSRMKIFEKNEIIKGDLNVEVWTNKGDQALVYYQGEKLKFYLRANKECYLRFIYHLADNQSVLLLDNYYVAAHMANKVIEIPDEFECAEPFGVETLQVNAQTGPFDALNTKNIQGYMFIDETLENVIIGTRGFKKTNTNIDKAEKRLVFTTLKK